MGNNSGRPVSPAGGDGTDEKETIASLKSNDLFSDPQFPATDESLFQDPEVKNRPHLVWKRPHELVSKPQMFVDGANREDVKQGELADCWFLAGAAAVATRPELIKQVVPDGQVLYGKGYKGLVTFHFWRMGTWKTVNIDDRLPVDEKNELYYAKCQDPNEFWLPLLEKAFAKFHGNYNNLDGGLLAESLTSLTGYITLSIETSKEPIDELFKVIRQDFINGGVITCSRGDINIPGLVPNHAYTVTGARRVDVPGEGAAKLLRVRNPYGQVEWKGEWNDNDPRWKKLPAAVRKEMEYHPEYDGEFWIKIEDFVKHFEGVTFATKVPEIEEDETSHFENLILNHNAWVKGKTAGGSKKNDIVKFATNPQYLMTVTEPDDPDDCQPGEAPDELVCHINTTCNVIVELVQEHNRKKFEDFFRIGFSVYPYKKSKFSKRLSADELKDLPKLPGSAKHYPSSSAVGRLDLEPGSYVVIPTTKMPDQEREFLLRMYCRKPISCKELS